MSEPTVHVVDDDDAIRDSLAFLLESAGLEARTYDSAGALLTRVSELEPGCILTDIRMPGMSGLELVRELKQQGVALPIIVMTGHADVPLAIETMKAGVVDFIEKPFDDELLLGSIRGAVSKGLEVAEHEQERLAVRERLASLSPRERDVLDGLVAGHPNKIIAFNLGISPRTVEIYRANLMTKMLARSLSDLVRMSMIAA